MNIKIDPEFKNELRPLTEDEYKKLESLILEFGCTDSLKLWNGILIDGHNRYEICIRNNIPFNTTEINLPDRKSVKEWIHLNNEARRNLTVHETVRITLEQRKESIAERAKENERKGADMTNTGLQKSANPIEKVDTRKELARIAGVSHDTVGKVETIEKVAPIPVRDASRR